MTAFMALEYTLGVAAESARLPEMIESTICRGCWQHLKLPIPFRGILSLPLKLFGLRPSRMNPYHLCNL
jgi:hypothetical protein